LRFCNVIKCILSLKQGVGYVIQFRIIDKASDVADLPQNYNHTKEPAMCEANACRQLCERCEQKSVAQLSA
jgi:hypothetical protein